MLSLQTTRLSQEYSYLLGANQINSRFREECTFVFSNKSIILKACRISLSVTAQVKFKWLCYKMRMMHEMKSIKEVDLCELPARCIEFTEQHTGVKGSESTVFTESHGCLFKEQADNSLEHENCAERSNSERHLHHLSQPGWICSAHVRPGAILTMLCKHWMQSPAQSKAFWCFLLLWKLKRSRVVSGLHTWGTAAAMHRTGISGIEIWTDN